MNRILYIYESYLAIAAKHNLAIYCITPPLDMLEVQVVSVECRTGVSGKLLQETLNIKALV